MPTTWTVVTVKGPFSPHAQPTGFEGTWTEATEFARTLDGFHEIWTVTTTDTTVDRGAAKPLRIAPTAKAKAVAKAREAEIDRLLAERDNAGFAAYLFTRAAGRIGVDPRELADRELAARYVDAGWDWSQICRAMS